MTTNSDEIARVLAMVQKGQVTPEEGSELIKALTAVSWSGPTESGTPGTMVHISVKEEGKQKVNVKLPLGLVNLGLGLVDRFVPLEDRHGVDFAELGEQVKKGMKGRLVEVNEEDTEIIIDIL